MSDQVSDERFRFAYAAHARSILGYALRRTNSATDAADVVAETMLVAWRRINDMPDEPETLLWLYGVARRVLANSHRRTRRQDRLAEKLRSHVVEALTWIDPPSPTLAADISAALHRLSDIEREILVLTASEELSPSEIATVIGMNQNTVRTHLRRARMKLRSDLVARGVIDRDVPRNATAVTDMTAQGEAPPCFPEREGAPT